MSAMPQEKNLFGTDGIRGVAGEYPITEAVAERLGGAVAFVLGKKGDSETILIGQDTRQSGAGLARASAQGVAAAGFNAQLCGVLPTPAIAYLVRHTRACAGIVISASHNPYTDNGFKIFGGGGVKCADTTEKEISDLIQKTESITQNAAKKGVIETWSDAQNMYADLACTHFGNGLDLQKYQLVVDTSNGAACWTTPAVLRRLSANLSVINDQPDGCNINVNCGSNHPDALAELTKKIGAHLGLAHDGDADRVCFCDETGAVLDGDEVLCILGLHLAGQKKLKNNTVVATVMSNCGLEEALGAVGVTVVRAAVGDKYVLEEMLRGDYNLGGEQSGHIILRDYNPTGDGLNTALQLLRVMQETGKPLSQLRRQMSKYPQLLVNVRVKTKTPIEDLPPVIQAVREVEHDLGSKGRVLLRYSGTEPKIRLLLEAKEEQLLKPLSEKILKPIKELIGA
jgi:phosphoglucosamine mutase